MKVILQVGTKYDYTGHLYDEVNSFDSGSGSRSGSGSGVRYDYVGGVAQGGYEQVDIANANEAGWPYFDCMRRSWLISDHSTPGDQCT